MLDNMLVVITLEDNANIMKPIDEQEILNEI
jgi:hypothetical protein